MTAPATQRSRSTKVGLGKAIAAQKATQDAPQLQREQPRHAPSSQKSKLLIENLSSLSIPLGILHSAESRSNVNRRV